MARSADGSLGAQLRWSPGPLTLAGDRAQTLGALAYAASESPPAARPRAELASVQKLASAPSGGSLELCTAMS
jgi:hypothetical protein